MTGTDIGGTDIGEVLEIVRRNRGFDFSGYKRASLERRIRHRMSEVGIDSLSGYCDFLEVHPEEFVSLFNTILINVTRFFRDTGAWDALAGSVVPAILDLRGPDSQVRVWSAGCASGEEAYSLAMLFDEALGTPAFVERVKIYGTDVDDDAIVSARRGEYTTKQLEGVAPERVDRYFEPAGPGRCVIRPEFRRRVVFGRHDLTRDTPISRVDLLVCRNTLIYLNTETQAEVIARFNFALNPGGYLFLGKSEALVRHTELFTPVDPAFRIYQRASRRRALASVPLPLFSTPDRVAPTDLPWLADEFDEPFQIAQVLVDGERRLVAANAAGRELLDLGAEDTGRSIVDIAMFQGPLNLEAAVERALGESQPSILRNVDMATPPDAFRYFDVRVDPLADGSEGGGAVSVVFLDVTRTMVLESQARESKENLATAMEELQSANEELETTNEELQSTNEELETTNEELQSTNEELETMNEELQSATEQFDALNREMQARAGAVNEVNTFLESVLGSVLAAVVVLDPRLVVVSWNHAAEQLWGVWSTEAVEHSFFGLDVGLPVEELRAPLLACLEGGSEREEVALPATNRRGREIVCRIAISPLSSGDGLVLLMEEVGG